MCNLMLDGFEQDLQVEPAGTFPVSDPAAGQHKNNGDDRRRKGHPLNVRALALAAGERLYNVSRTEHKKRLADPDGPLRRPGRPRKAQTPQPPKAVNRSAVLARLQTTQAPSLLALPAPGTPAPTTPVASAVDPLPEQDAEMQPPPVVREMVAQIERRVRPRVDAQDDAVADQASSSASGAASSSSAVAVRPAQTTPPPSPTRSGQVGGQGPPQDRAEMPIPAGPPASLEPPAVPAVPAPPAPLVEPRRPRGPGRARLDRENAVRRIAEESALAAARSMMVAARQEREQLVQRAELPPEPPETVLDPNVPGWEDFTEEDVHERFRSLVTEDPSLQLAGEELEGLTVGVRSRLRLIPEDVK